MNIILQKESPKLNLITNPKLYKNKSNNINKQLFELGRLKSQDNHQNKIDINNFNSLYDKYTRSNPSFNQNFLIKRAIRKLKKNKSIGEMMHSNNILLKRKKKFLSNKQINIEQSNDISQIILTNKLYDDIKIRNIISLWNELEVLEPYRKYFLFVFKEIDDEDKISFYQNEVNEMIQLKNDIKNLTYNIELRFGFINKIFELNEKLNNEKVDQYLINEMLKKFKDLIQITVNIVLYMKKIKSIINAVPNLGKYDIDIISKKFNFDKNYIIKMKFETKFLKEGCAKMFFDFKKENTPFFLKTNNDKSIFKDEEYNYTISFEPKVINDIKECNYYIYKELIAYENDKSNINKFRNISPIRRKNPEHNFFSNFNINTHEFNNDRVKKRQKLFLNKVHGNKKNEILEKTTMNLKRELLDNSQANNLSKLMKNFEFHNENVSNNNKINKIDDLNLKLKENSNIYKKSKINNFYNSHSKLNKKNLFYTSTNNSEIKFNKDVDLMKKFSSPNTIDNAENNDKDFRIFSEDKND